MIDKAFELLGEEYIEKLGNLPKKQKIIPNKMLRLKSDFDDEPVKKKLSHILDSLPKIHLDLD